MKKSLFLLLLLLACSLGAKSQELYVMSKVIKVDSSLTKESIYNKIKEYVGMEFVSAKKGIQVDDKDAGLIIINALQEYSYGKLVYIASDGYLNYTLKIQIKNGRFKVEVTNFNHEVKLGGNKSWALGLITVDEEYPYKCSSINRSFYNNIWSDLRFKSTLIAAKLFADLESLKFNTNDNW